MIIKVQSETNPNTTYAVTIHNGLATGCTCPAARWHSGLCKHANGVNRDQDQVRYLSRKARYQVATDNIGLMDAIHATVSQGPTHRPTADQVAALARIVNNVSDAPDGDVERRVLGGLLNLLHHDARVLTAA